MYPIFRMGLEIMRVRKLHPIGLFDEHRSEIRILPSDLDMFFELNNGRTLTLYDIARVAHAKRSGLWDVMKKKKIGMTVAGVSVQYRKRITLGQKITMTAQAVGMDERFVYVLQNCFRANDACGQALLRMAFVKNGILSPRTILKEEFQNQNPPEIPDWIEGYINAAANRPWPPKGE